MLDVYSDEVRVPGIDPNAALSSLLLIIQARCDSGFMATRLFESVCKFRADPQETIMSLSIEMETSEQSFNFRKWLTEQPLNFTHMQGALNV